MVIVVVVVVVVVVAVVAVVAVVVNAISSYAFLDATNSGKSTFISTKVAYEGAAELLVLSILKVKLIKKNL